MAKGSDERTGVTAYFILTYAIMLLTWGMMAVFQIPGVSAISTTAKSTPAGILLFFLGGLSPSIAGVFMTWRVSGRAGLGALWKRTTQSRFGWKWYLAILLVPMLVMTIQIVVQLMRGQALSQSRLLAQPLNLVGFTIAIILGGAISEEFGWRGFALERLLSGSSPWVASLILGIPWALWHLSLFFIPGTVQASRGNVVVEFSIFALWIISLAILFTWIYISTGRSLFAVLLFHATVDWFNSFSGTVMNGDTIERLIHALSFAILAAVVLIWWSGNRRSITHNQDS